MTNFKGEFTTQTRNIDIMKCLKLVGMNNLIYINVEIHKVAADVLGRKWLHYSSDKVTA